MLQHVILIASAAVLVAAVVALVYLSVKLNGDKKKYRGRKVALGIVISIATIVLVTTVLIKKTLKDSEQLPNPYKPESYDIWQGMQQQQQVVPQTQMQADDYYDGLNIEDLMNPNKAPSHYPHEPSLPSEFAPWP